MSEKRESNILSPEDEITQKKELDKAQQRKVMRKSTYIIFFGIIVASALTVLVVKQSLPIKERFEAVAPTNELLLRDLKAFTFDAGEYTQIKGSVSQEDELSFKVSVLRPTFVELIASSDDQKIEILFYTRLPPGRDRLLERQGNRFSYHAKLDGKATKFCVVYADSKVELQRMNSSIDFIWRQLPESSCVIVHGPQITI